MISPAFRPLKRARLIFVSLILFSLAPLQDGKAQVDVSVGGLAYVDYFYTLSSPVDAEENLHGFTYRRLYLTTDFRFSEEFKGRARLEANDGTTGAKGPVPFVKDLYLTWNYSGDHSVTMGVAPPPVYEVTERVWGYLSLEKTIMDLQGVADSRDFGIRFNGPLAPEGRIRYGVMLANNSASKPETDAYKRGYAQIEFYPVEHVIVTVSADHAGFGKESALEATTRASALGAFSSDKFSLGVEPYYYVQTFDVGEEGTALGVSVFGRVVVAPKWEIISRLDQVREEHVDTVNETFFLAGAAFRPTQGVKIIPNIWLFDSDVADKAKALARLTLDFTF